MNNTNNAINTHQNNNYTEENKMEKTNDLINNVDSSEFEHDSVNNGTDTLVIQNKAELAVRQEIVTEIDKSEFEDLCKSETLNTILKNNGVGVLGIKGVPIYLLDDGISGFYARRIELKGGMNMIALNKYETGKAISDDILIDNYDINQIYASAKEIKDTKKNTSTQEDINKELLKNGKKSFIKVVKIISKYSLKNEMIDATIIINSLIANYSRLDSDNQDTIDINKIYCSIVDFVNQECYEGLFTRKGFYAFNDQHFSELVDEIMLTKQQLLEILIKNNLLYIQNSSGGYQSKVRGMGNCYCIKTLKCFQSIESFEQIDKDDEKLNKSI